MTQVLCVVGARPNFMKIAPIMAAFAEAGIAAQLLHTGQHYDEAMNDSFFADLGIPRPDHHLEVGSASHAVQTAEVMRRFEPVLERVQPQSVLVVGDVNSTIACALVAAKRGVRVIHVEGGLRSFDRSMPEEVNRVLTDQISDLLFTTERSAQANLEREGIDPARVHFVGNVMIDTLHRNLARAIPSHATLGQALSQYAVLTLHRPSNVDNRDTLRALLEVMSEINRTLPVVLPLHPRTRGSIEKFGLTAMLDGMRILPPVGYLEMLGLMRDAKLVLTDSGGIQEETTALGVPCLTLRENTERPITLTEGTNTLVGPDPRAIRAAFSDVMAGGGKAGRIPEYWDGRAATRIAQTLLDWLPRQNEHGAVRRLA
jgi:UDP-N-acetylglucosamine 2-epimerase (non-hydrolysing)